MRMLTSLSSHTWCPTRIKFPNRNSNISTYFNSCIKTNIKPATSTTCHFTLGTEWNLNKTLVFICSCYSFVNLIVLFFFVLFLVVLIEWVQAAHLQGQDDPDHQVWNKGYQSKYVVLLCETGDGEEKKQTHRENGNSQGGWKKSIYMYMRKHWVGHLVLSYVSNKIKKTQSATCNAFNMFPS